MSMKDKVDAFMLISHLSYCIRAKFRQFDIAYIAQRGY